MDAVFLSEKSNFYKAAGRHVSEDMTTVLLKSNKPLRVLSGTPYYLCKFRAYVMSAPAVIPKRESGR
jgi:hypothetical protein